MKVLITNTVALNGGEAATVRSIVDLLRRVLGEDTRFVIYEQHPEAASKYYPDLTFRAPLYYRVSQAPGIPGLRRLIGVLNRGRFYLAARCWCGGRRSLARGLVTSDQLRELEEYSSADLIVSSGGTYLVENYDLRPRIFDYKISLLMRRPLVFFTQSMGPFRNRRNRRSLRKILEQARLVLLRDEASLEHVRDLDIKSENVHVCTDAVFGLSQRKSITRRKDEQLIGKSPLRVAISVRYWPYFKNVSAAIGMERYRFVMAAVAAHLVRKHGAEITFISTCQGIPEYWADDSAVAKDMVDLLDESVKEHVRVDRFFRTPERMLEELESFDLVIATRFHMAVLALVAGTPALAVAYEFKTNELFRRLGLQDWVQDIETIDAHGFCEAVDRCMETRDSVVERITRAVAEAREAALKVGDLLKRVVAAPA